ncbi:hypothetical protein [Anaerococcus lactolyticus]|uniref:Lipoprotein n=1 Tax=Anaerococcus lactolyticus S7-1-13 TaxID=1284686 RepID=A0A095Z904_9FIRM|nr:hypothetical protein [Anaerococcus lactolyticus]KGF04954.1 hypothetical protein HMPREF1630_01865 [Anaerococcus lactolyticus S7-1-13]
MKIILALILTLILSSCGFESKSEFKKDMGETASEEKMKFPEIKYVSNTESEDDVDFEKVYGKGHMSSKIYLKDALGFLKKFDFAGKKIGVEVLESSYSPSSYTAVLAFKDKDNIVEKEYGPLVTSDNVFSQVNFDLVEAESGPCLIASQVVIDGKETKSAYYIYNKYMSLIDSFHFENSTDDVNVNVYRMSKPVEASENPKPGDLEMAISKRIDKEEEYLKEIFSVYKIESQDVKAEINGRKVLVGLMPATSSDRIIELKLLDKDKNDAILSIK